MGLSQRAYARHRGVSEAAVRKALKTGRITAERNGSIDPLKADQQWQANTIKSERVKKAPLKIQTPFQTSFDAPDSTAPKTTYLQAKTAHEVLKVQTSKVRLQSLKGALIDREKAAAHVFALARAERDSWLNWPARIASAMAKDLKVDSHTLQIILEDAVRQHLVDLGSISVRLEEEA